jgi:hypothetical protein
MSANRYQSPSKYIVHIPLTSVLNAVFRQDTMAPITDTTDSLYTTRSMRTPRVKLVTGLVSVSTAQVQVMDVLPEVATDAVPFFAVRVAADRLIWGRFNVMREREPIVTAVNISN